MRILEFTIKQYEKELLRRHGRDKLAEINSIIFPKLPRLVYISFDGDHLSESELMKQFVLRRNKTPLNPESALGTHLVTNHYSGEKYNIIVDCLSLLNICDEFWIMTDQIIKESADFESLSEGVLAELLYWSLRKNKYVSVTNIDQYKGLSEFVIDTDNQLESLHPLKRKGIRSILAIATNKLRRTVYLATGEKHAKHSDWLRKDAYINLMVPVCPYTLLNSSTLKLAYKNDQISQLKARVSLAIKTDAIWIYGSYLSQDFNLSTIESDLLLELYLVFKFKKVTPKIGYKYFGEVGIPKYANRHKWAITEYEKIHES